MAPSDNRAGSNPWSASPALTSPVVADGATVDRWAQAVENLEDARQAAESLVRTVDEAIYMVSVLPLVQCETSTTSAACLTCTARSAAASWWHLVRMHVLAN